MEHLRFSDLLCYSNLNVMSVQLSLAIKSGFNTSTFTFRSDYIGIMKYVCLFLLPFYHNFLIKRSSFSDAVATFIQD